MKINIKKSFLSGVITATLLMSSHSATAHEHKKPQPKLPMDVVEYYKAPQGLQINEADKKRVTKAVLKASEEWKSAFNRGDAGGAADQYEEGSVMTAMPFGIFIGKKSIQAFWTNIISQGFKDVKYMNTKLEVVSKEAAVVSASWEMNNAYGIITKELWILQEDGSAKLRVDDFEIVGAK